MPDHGGNRTYDLWNTDHINDDEFDDMQNVVPAVVPVIPSERRNIRNSSKILGTVGASDQEKHATSATSKNGGQGTQDYLKNKRVVFCVQKVMLQN
jgi:hypothetical protein